MRLATSVRSCVHVSEREPVAQASSSFANANLGSRTLHVVARTKQLPEAMRTAIREVINDLMRTRFRTQKALAKALGVPASQLSDFANGTKGLGINAIVEIARVAGMSVDEVLGRSKPRAELAAPALFELVARDAGLPEASIRAAVDHAAASDAPMTVVTLLRFAEYHASIQRPAAPDKSRRNGTVSALPRK